MNNNKYRGRLSQATSHNLPANDFAAFCPNPHCNGLIAWADSAMDCIDRLRDDWASRKFVVKELPRRLIAMHQQRGHCEGCELIPVVVDSRANATKAVIQIPSEQIKQLADEVAEALGAA